MNSVSIAPSRSVSTSSDYKSSALFAGYADAFSLDGVVSLDNQTSSVELGPFSTDSALNDLAGVAALMDNTAGLDATPLTYRSILYIILGRLQTLTLA